MYLNLLGIIEYFQYPDISAFQLVARSYIHSDTKIMGAIARRSMGVEPSFLG